MLGLLAVVRMFATYNYDRCNFNEKMTKRAQVGVATKLVGASQSAQSSRKPSLSAHDAPLSVNTTPHQYQQSPLVGKKPSPAPSPLHRAEYVTQRSQRGSLILNKRSSYYLY